MDLHTLPVKRRSCFKCGYEAETADGRCPRCGRRLKTSGEIRGLGAVLIVLGGFLMVFVGAIGIWMINTVRHGTPGHPGFNGSQQEMLAAFGIIGMVVLFGFISFITGLWQLVFGRRNKVFVWTIIILAIILYVGGSIVLYLFDR